LRIGRLYMEGGGGSVHVSFGVEGPLLRNEIIA